MSDMAARSTHTDLSVYAGVLKNDDDQYECPWDIPGVTARMTCGACPVQIEGTVDDQHFYFRSRWDEWQFGVGNSLEDAVCVAIGMADGFCLEGEGDSWMPHNEAWRIVAECIEAYRKYRSSDAQRAGAAS